MAYQTSMIKDLSIALEALTRVQGVENEFERVRDLLRDAIGAKEAENIKAYIEYHEGRAKHTPTKTNSNDEIPF